MAKNRAQISFRLVRESDGTVVREKTYGTTADWFELHNLIEQWGTQGFTLKVSDLPDYKMKIVYASKPNEKPGYISEKEMVIHTSSKKISADLVAAVNLYNEVRHNEYAEIY